MAESFTYTFLIWGLFQMDLIFSTYFLHLATYLYYEGEKLDYGTNSKFLTIFDYFDWFF